MTVLLLFCFINLSAKTNKVFYGVQEQPDSIIVAVNDLRIANTIMVKSNIQDTIIQLKDSLIYYQNEKIILLNNSYKEMKDYAIKTNEINSNLNKSLNKSKKKTLIISGVAGSAIAAFIVSLLIK